MCTNYVSSHTVPAQSSIHRRRSESRELDRVEGRWGQSLVRCPEFIASASWRASLAGGLEEATWLDHLTRQSGAEQAVSSEIIPQRSRHYRLADQLQASNLVFFIFLFLFFRLFQLMLQPFGENQETRPLIQRISHQEAES